MRTFWISIKFCFVTKSERGGRATAGRRGKGFMVAALRDASALRKGDCAFWRDATFLRNSNLAGAGASLISCTGEHPMRLRHPSVFERSALYAAGECPASGSVI